MSDHDLSIAAMERILKAAGAQRVSHDAKEELRKHVERHATKLAQRAVRLADHADRATVQEDDIELATQD